MVGSQPQPTGRWLGSAMAEASQVQTPSLSRLRYKIRPLISGLPRKVQVKPE